MPAFFVTATGTDVGKTFLTQGLVRSLRKKGREAAALKPIVSGFSMAAAAGSDPAVLLEAMGRAANNAEIDRISPWRFTAPLSPDMAAVRENRRIVLEEVVQFSREAANHCIGTMFIEGVGGVMVPLDERHTVLDWMQALRYPVILVAGSYLGTISHTLSAMDVLKQRDVPVAAVVISETAGSSVSLSETVATISRFTQPTRTVGLPRLAHVSTEHAAFEGVLSMLETYLPVSKASAS